MTPPRALVALVRWLHQANTWTVRRLTREPDRRFGWSALSWWGSEVRVPPSPTLRVMRVLIDALFGRDHCRLDYERIRAGEPFGPGWRECAAGLGVVLVPLAVVAVVMVGK
jgi:hypothetical protein